VTPAVECAGLALGYGSTRVLTGLDLSVAPGEVLALLGPSGSGKSTLLHAIAGFVVPVEGEIRLGGRTVSTPRLCIPPERRRIGLVFQDYALWPHLSTVDTVAYPYRRRGASRAVARERARALLDGMSLGALAGRRPGQLSGGEQQRVGLARALAAEPALYLFDEPTAHLDAPLRAQVLAEVAQRRAASGAAAVYATHDSAEALAIADRVAVLYAGRAAQVGTPAEVYERPASLDVARLTGPVSVLAAGSGTALVRPDWAALGGERTATVESVRFTGPHTDYALATPDGTVVVREPGPPRHAPGAEVGWTLHRSWPVPPILMT
jgi:ABC-type Fe3+/spermidine/putrescine transport system ATPase subunit